MGSEERITSSRLAEVVAANAVHRIEGSQSLAKAVSEDTPPLSEGIRHLTSAAKGLYVFDVVVVEKVRPTSR